MGILVVLYGEPFLILRDYKLLHWKILKIPGENCQYAGKYATIIRQIYHERQGYP